MVTTNKLVQIPMDHELLAQLDRLSRAEGNSRSAVIRRACREYLKRLEEERLDAIYEEGYRRIPEDSSVGEAQVAIAKEMLAEESW
jgi:metal-responsive CopG/Arc/MetJ family transcriptional regulator